MSENDTAVMLANNGKGVRPFNELAAALANDPGVLKLETGALAQSVLRLFGARILDRTLPSSEPGETIATYVSRVWQSLASAERAAVERAGIRNMQTLAEFSVVAIQRELWDSLQAGTWTANDAGFEQYRQWAENTLISSYGRSASYAWKWAVTMVALHLLYQNRGRLALGDALDSEPLAVFQGGTFNRYLRCGAHLVDQFEMIRQANDSATWAQLEKLRKSGSLDETGGEPRAYLWRAMAAIRRLLGLVNNLDVRQHDIDAEVAKSRPNVAPVTAVPSDGGYTANLDPVQLGELRRVGLLREDCPEPITAQYRLVMRPTCSRCNQPLWLETGSLPAEPGRVFCPGCNCHWQAEDESADPRVDWRPTWLHRAATDTGWNDWQAVDVAPDLEHAPLAGAPVLDELWGVSIVTWTVKEDSASERIEDDRNDAVSDDTGPGQDSTRAVEPVEIQPGGGNPDDRGVIPGEGTGGGEDVSRAAIDEPALIIEVGACYLHSETPGLLLRVAETNGNGKIKATVLRQGQGRLEVGKVYTFRASALLPE